jgi:DNA mismatch repair protein MutS2
MKRLKAKQDRKKNKKNGEAASGAASGTHSGSGLGSSSGLGASSSDNAPKVKPIEAGETVRIKGQTSVGEVTAVNGKNAQVTFGNLKTTVALARLERAAAPTAAQKPIAKSTFVSAETQDRVYEKKLAFKQDIDVRGMRGDEAIQAVTYFIDDAILLGINRVRILHGTGSGILRTLIRDYLSGVPGVAHFQDEHVQFGGAGITVVDLE